MRSDSRFPGTVLVGAVLTLLVAVAYGASLRNEFVFDDMIFMQHDPRLRSLSQATRLFVEPLWGFTDDEGRTHAHQYYRPLQTLPLALSRAAFGEAAWPSHVLNLLLHVLNTMIVFVLIRRLLQRSRDQGIERPSAELVDPVSNSISRSLDHSIAAWAAALFAVHPAYSEAVLWISNVAGLGVAACTLAIVLIHASDTGRRVSAQLAVVVLCLVGLWFKEAGVLVPALMVLYDVTLAPGRGWSRLRRVRWRYAVLVVPCAIYYALRLRALGGTVPGLAAVPLTPWELAINAIALVPQYVATFLWPVDLNMYYDFDAIHSVWEWRFAGGLTLLATSAMVAIVCWRRHALVTFGIAWAWITVSPHLLARWPQLNVFAERYLYLPAVGALIVAAYGVQRLQRARRHRRALAWGAATLLLAALVVDVRRTGDWHDEVTLYTKTLTQSRRAELIRINLGLKLYELGRHDEGVAVLQALMSFDPSWHDAWHNLGLLYMAKNQDAEAVNAFEHAHDRDPSSAETLLNLGYLYDRAGRRDAAVAAYFRAVRIQPHNTKVWYNLATIAVELGQLDNARAAVAAMLRAAPEDAEARALQQRLAMVPDQSTPQTPAASVATAERCATAKQAVDAGRYEDAIIELLRAAWYDEASPLPHQYLANVYYLTGRIGDAVREQREALERAPDNELYRRNLIALENAARDRGTARATRTPPP